MKKHDPDAAQTDEETANDNRNNHGEISSTVNNPNLIAEESLLATTIAEEEGLAENKLPQKGQTDSSKGIAKRHKQAYKERKEKCFSDEGKQTIASSDSVVSTTGYDETILSTIPDDTNTSNAVQTETTPTTSSLPRASEENDAFSDNQQPGAHPVPGRAPGTIPAWGRRAARAARSSQRQRSSTRESHNIRVVATVVEEDEETLPTVYPTSVKTGESISRNRRKLFLLFGFLVCILIGLVVVLIVTLGGKESDTGKTTTKTSSKQSNTTWAERDSLKCSILFKKNGLGYLNEETGNYEGLVVDLCYAIAAALFGEGYRDRVIFKVSEIFDGKYFFSTLKKKEVDLLMNSITHTMERQVYMADLDTGFSFTAPYYYSGLTYGGDPEYVKCMDDENVSGKCSDLRVCVFAQTTHVKIVKDIIGEENFVEVRSSSLKEFYGYLNTPLCNVVAAESLSETIAKEINVTGPFEVSSKVLSKEPLAMVTLHDEPQWSDFVNWVLQALFTAEKHNITQKIAHEMPTTDVFGEKFRNMFIDAISAVGNYGEIYSRHMEAIIPRQNLNTINNGSSGLIYSHPFGQLDDDAPSGHTEGGVLENIFQRGYLKCGVVQYSTLDGSSTEANLLTGLVEDYCYALSAGIFHDYSDETKAKKTNITSISPEEAAALLNKKEVDVIGPVAVNLVNDVTGNISFSQPIYYNSQNDPLALATFQDDVQWSSFVYWAVSATFYAEEKKYSKNTSKQMPLLNVFGPHHKMMLRNIIAAAGNYGDIFERNNDTLGRRDGLNLLNSNNGPQIYPLPGIFD